MNKFPLFVFVLLFLSGCAGNSVAQAPKNMQRNKPKISFTFDDGITTDIAGFKFEDWNRMILDALEQAGLKAVFFVTGSNKLDKKGAILLKSWDEMGHRIGNHSFTHPNFNSQMRTVSDFEKELRQTDKVISKFSHRIKRFRFPYLKEGGDARKVNRIRKILAENQYSNGYVTVDCSDWYINARLIKRIGEKGLERTRIDEFRKFYLEHVLDRAKYYEKLSFELNQRHISHTLLLHHNLTSALFLADLIEAFKGLGWEVVDADLAYDDQIFQTIPEAEFAGESLIWSLAKQSGQYQGSLRYPAEDSRYEAPKMDKLGL